MYIKTPPGVAVFLHQFFPLAMVCRWGGLSALLCAGLTAARAAATPSFIWIEGEKPATENVATTKDNLGRPDWLSGGSWRHFGIDAGDVKTKVPADGALLSYTFKADRLGAYEVWTRLGFETGHTPFEWHVDGGEWQQATPHLTDLVELQFFSEIGWQDLGAQILAPGEHKFEIRVPRNLDKNGNGVRMLFGLNAVCLSVGKFKPGEDWRDNQDREAASHVFPGTGPDASGKQMGLALAGTWEVRRDDEDAPKVVDEPLAGPPESAFWTATPVPSNKNTSRRDLQLAHRLWFRTRVSVPASARGLSCYLIFPPTSLNATVLVNGAPCGFIPEPLVRAQFDVTKAVELMRLWGEAGWEGMNVFAALDWLDQHGVVLRHTGIMAART